MNPTINKKLESISIFPIDQDTAALYMQKCDHYCVVASALSPTGNISFQQFDSALKMADKEGKNVISNPFLLKKVSDKKEPRRWAQIYYDRIGDQYWMQIKTKEAIELEVSVQYYQECMAEIDDQRKQDRLYGYQGNYDPKSYKF